MTHHHCHANGCTWATERRLFMCLQHWTRLPSALQQPIWTAYRASKNAGERGRSIAYMTACADAVEFIAKLEGKPIENSYRRAAVLLQRQAQMQLPQMTAGIEAMLAKAPVPANAGARHV